jgi:hypothetical protein
MGALLRAGLAWIVVVTTGLVANRIADGDWNMVGGLLYSILLPVVLAMLFPLSGYTWPDVTGVAGGLALGVPVLLLVTFDSSDSGELVRWLGAAMYALFIFPLCFTAGALARAISHLLYPAHEKFG